MAGEAPPSSAAIFDDVFFAIIPGNSIDKITEDKISKDLISNGATKLDFGSVDLDQITHLISTHTEFPAYHDAIDGFIHVVKPSWVETSIDKRKATNPRQYSPDPLYFFSDVMLHCAEDIPHGDKEAIIGGVHAMGGQYSPRMTKLVTHLVALTHNTPQCRLIAEKKLKCLPVLPHWFDACLKLGKKINPQPYIIPSEGLPLLYTELPTDPLRPSQPDEDLSLSTAGTWAQHGLLPVSPSKQRRELQVFKNKRVMLHEDLGLSPHLRDSLVEIIGKAGGSIVDSHAKTNMLICQFRGSREFVDASQAGIDVGNLNWLYYLINRNRWSDPTRRLLNYPYPEGGIAGFSELKISLSNYQGDTRVWLEALVTALGGNFTKSMAQENTHLITAHPHSDKCDAAREWGIDMVNHLWLEESYAKCEMQPLTNRRYTEWPARSNLGEVVGQTPIDRVTIGRMYWPQREQSSPREAGADDDVESVPTIVRTPAANSNKKRRTAQTPAQRLAGADETPGSRGAKDRALSKLQDMASDIKLFEKETKRVGGVVYGGRRVTDTDRIILGDSHKTNLRKRSVSEAQPTSVDSDGDLDVPLPFKKQKTQKKAVVDHSVLQVVMTGVSEADTYRSRLKGLGLRFPDENVATRVDVLVAGKLGRTKKFLCALPNAPVVVNAGWVTAMLKRNTRVPLEDYLLKDPENEGELDMTLNESLERARRHKVNGGMLYGSTIFGTENTTGGFETLKDVVTANGGKCMLFKGRDTKIPYPKSSKKPDRAADCDVTDVEMEDDETREKSTIINLVSDEADRPLWKKFQRMAQEQGFNARIVKSDWLWRIGMSQNPDEWQDEWKFC